MQFNSDLVRFLNSVESQQEAAGQIAEEVHYLLEFYLRLQARTSDEKVTKLIIERRKALLKTLEEAHTLF